MGGQRVAAVVEEEEDVEELQMQQLRSKATELLLREEWNQSIAHYTHFISLCETHLSNPQRPNLSKLNKSLCLALSNRADAKTRIGYLSEALDDCDQALKIEPNHLKTLTTKGKILLGLARYTDASECFRRARNSGGGGADKALDGLFGRCKRLETQSRTGAIDVSDWVRNGFRDKAPELAEYVGPVEIRRSALAGRGIFAVKAVEAGTPLFVTEAVSVGRAMLPDQADQSRERAQLVMWKGFVEQVLEKVKRCGRTVRLIYALSADEVPETELFRPNSKERAFLNEKPDVGRILEVLDVNSLTEEAISAKKLGSDDGGCHGVGLWLLASLVNHSCIPNVRRLHIGDHMVVFASRDVKAGEEITFAYFDVLLPLKKRRALAKAWGFQCGCERCVFEEGACHAELIEGVEGEGDAGKAVVRLEEGLKRWATKARERGWLRASFWGAFLECYKSEKPMKKWGRLIPAEAVVTESVAEAVGGDGRVLKAAAAAVKKNGGGGGVGGFEMERVLKMGRGVYGKVMKKQAMRSLLGLDIHE